MKLWTGWVSLPSVCWVMGVLMKSALHCVFSADTCLYMTGEPVSAIPLPPTAKWQSIKLGIWENTVFYRTQVFRQYRDRPPQSQHPRKRIYENTQTYYLHVSTCDYYPFLCFLNSWKVMRPIFPSQVNSIINALFL